MENENIEVSQIDPATAQEVREAKLLISQSEARIVLGFDLDPYTDTELLTHYRNSVYPKIDKKDTKNLKQVIDAKNILLRLTVEKQIEQNGKFDLQIPFANICPICKGAGETYKFFKEMVEVPCKFCDEGEVIITCPACKGTGRFVKDNGDLKINVKCKKCNKEDKESGESVPVVTDKETGKPLIGKIKVRCRMCRGSGKFQKLVIDSHIKSTTYCRSCRGKGFTQLKEPDNPVISQDLGKVIKDAVATE